MTAGIDAAALKPCPFCQGSPLVCDTDINGYAVACENGKCGSSSGVFPTKPMAVRAWNTRQSPSTPVEQREAVARIIDPDAEWDKRPSNSEMPAVMKDNAVFSMRRSAALRKATAILALPGSSRDEALEEAAKVAECAGCGDPKCSSCYGNQIASAIRALKSGGAK